MHLVNDQYQTKDRWILNIQRLTPGQSQTFNPTGTDYIMLAGASMVGKYSSVNEATAACTMTTPYTVSCGKDSYAAIVSYPGLCLPDSTITVIDPSTQGNLSYMDGGTNTNAVNPSRSGDPVINYVFFPKGMDQTPHVHPSHRIGFCISGHGQTDLIGHSVPLSRGDLFFMGRMELHHFLTPKDDCVLFVFAPDSETGPTDERNPLKARTYIQSRDQELG
jgi:quercetin dioxygenase-like cupin family protein